MNTRSFDAVWADIKRLEDETVKLLVRGNAYLVFKVDDKNGVSRQSIHRKGQAKPVAIWYFRNAWKNLCQDKKFAPAGDKKVGYFACACLAHLPEIEYSKNPLTLYLIEKEEDYHPFCQVKER